MPSPQIVWLRRDLRLRDHPAFHAAAQSGPVIPVYVLDDDGAGERQLGSASRWWLHGSLSALAKTLEQRGSKLILRRGNSAREVARLAEEVGAGAVHAIHHYEPWWREAEASLGGALDLVLHDSNYLLPPGSVTTGAGGPFRIYTPFARAAMRELPAREPLPEAKFAGPDRWPRSDALADWQLLPTAPDWAGGLRDSWKPGEAAAGARLDSFLAHVDNYAEDRNHPSVEGSSRLSPHLHWGEISPTRVWEALSGRRGPGVDSFRGELLWRDFAQNLIAQFPGYAEDSHRPAFRAFPWRDPERDAAARADLHAWHRGRTGYPIVDAGMRQLWTSGWMHNRVRMITASFLIKHLLIDWRIGERWFWDTLIDGDYANNATNWQWVAGSGVDASLFTRIMAPLSQSAKFDAAGYIRQWVPELAGLSDEDIHDPAESLRPPGYPAKLIGHREARERALAAYRSIRDSD
ncbi:MAG: deoxyribodipyrimidine photo-lyase [Novosphingobium sp.]